MSRAHRSAADPPGSQRVPQHDRTFATHQDDAEINALLTGKGARPFDKANEPMDFGLLTFLVFGIPIALFLIFLYVINHR